MLLRRWHPPLWVAVLAAPLLCNLFAVTGAAIGYYGFGWSWAPLAMLPVWFRFAALLLGLIDSYKTTESRRALAVFGAMVWLIASFILIFAVADGVEAWVRG